MKRILLVVLAVILSITLFACNDTGQGGQSNGTETKTTKKDDGVRRIGFSMADITGQAVQVEAKSFEDTAKAKGFDEVIILSAENSVETQIAQIKDMITKECDVICIYGSDPEGIVPAVEACNRANIPVIAVDRGIHGGEIDFTVESNNISDGRDIAQHFGLKTAGQPEGSVEILHIIGNLSSTAQRERHEGFRIGCMDWPQLKIISEPATDAVADKIYNAVVDAFKTNPNIKAIMVPYDQLLNPVVSALKEIGKFYPVGDPNHIMLGSVDGATEQLEWLSEGINDVVISLDFVGFGSYAASTAADFVDGKVPSSNVLKTVSNVVTKDNVKQLTAQGKLWGKSK